MTLDLPAPAGRFERVTAYATIRPREEIGMAILKVARLGHPVLRKVAAPVPVSEIGSAETQRLIDDMIETMRDTTGPAWPRRRSTCSSRSA